jgi:hypothetical protein
MGIEVVWENEEKTIVRWIFSGDFNWGDYDEGSRRLEEMIANVNHNFATIFDLSQMTALPKYAVSQYPKLIRDVPARQETLVIISLNRLVRSLGRIFTRVYRMNIHFVLSLEDALALISELRMRKFF